MASSRDSRPEEDYCCPVCRDIFKDPVILSCSHSFCNACLQNWWREKRINQCPVCKEIHSTGNPLRNLALKNLCEAFMQERLLRASKRQRTSSGSEELCSLHAEKLKLFCQECQQPVCVVCLHSEKHTTHSFRPIDEAALEHKEEVQELLKPLQKKLVVFNNMKKKSDQTARHFKAQAWHTETQIKEKFKKLHQFLQEEEEWRITALREEEQQKSQMMMEKIEALTRDILTISNNIRDIEEELRGEHISFLQNYKTTMERVQFTPQDPQPVLGPLMDVTKHLGNLTFRIWNKMKDIVSYTPVILDPNTAFPSLTLSNDLTSVRHGEIQRLPDNPERFRSSTSVLGYEGFNSGTHTWDVDVGDNENWQLGVATKIFGKCAIANGDAQVWILRFTEGKFTGFCRVNRMPASTDLSVKQKPQRIRVQLDWNEGKLSFSDPDSNTHIHTFTHPFIDTLVPCIGTDDDTDLKILPGKVSASVEQHS